MFARFPGRRPRGWGPAAAAWLCALAALAGPWAHALAEEPRGTASLEATHSQQCDRLHSDTSCPAAGMLGTLPAQGPPAPSVPVQRAMTAPGIAADLSAMSEFLSTRFVRGPPAT